jgi:hypothetical protein
MNSLSITPKSKAKAVRLNQHSEAAGSPKHFLKPPLPALALTFGGQH